MLSRKTIKVKFVDVDYSGRKKKGSVFCESNSENNDDEIERKYDGNFIKEFLDRHYNIEDSDDPDYVFTYVPVGDAKGYDFSNYPNSVIIFDQRENVFPDMFMYDYVLSRDIDFNYGDRTCFIPFNLLVLPYTRDKWNMMNEKHLNCNDELFDRKFCSFLVSNGNNATKRREDFFHMLSSYKKVDSGGSFLNNMDGFHPKDKVEFERGYKFVIAFDNGENGIIQEKLPLAFASQTIPIYYGNPSVTKIYNSKAFINCHEYDSFEDVIKKVIELDNNKELYMSMLREPALLNPKDQDTVEKEVEDFLVRIIETPKELAIHHGNSNWMGVMSKIRIDGLKRRYRKVFIRNRVVRVWALFSKIGFLRSIKNAIKATKS